MRSTRSRKPALRTRSARLNCVRGLSMVSRSVSRTSWRPQESPRRWVRPHLRRPANATYDAQCVLRLKRAGGLVMGKTVTTEFAFMQPGKTRNPWNAAHTPGGSSSGSAAAVALGQVSAALGTQTNGSVIRPAAYCGVVGFKPTKDAVPYEGVTLFSPTLDTLGVFARTVADCAVIAGCLVEGELPRSALTPLARAPRLAWPDACPWV